MLKSQGNDPEFEEKELESVVNIFKHIPLPIEMSLIEEVSENSESSDEKITP